MKGSRTRTRTVVVTPEQYFPRRLDDRWKAALPWLPNSRLLSLEDCGKLHRLWRCSDNPEHERVTRIGCKDLLCYVCSSGRKMEQVADKMELLDTLYSELHETVSCSMFTFTIPSDLWERIDQDTDALPKLERKVVEILADHFGGEFVSVGGQKRVRRYVLGGDVVGQFFHSFHPAKECRGKGCRRCSGRGCKGNVWKGADYHVHVIVYSLMYDRLCEVYGLDGLSKGAFVRRTLSLSAGEVRKMCFELGGAWRRGVEADYGKSSASEFVVNYRYYLKGHDVEFCLGYVFRPEVQDTYREVVYNCCPPRTDEERAWFKRMLTLRKPGSHRHSGFGWMSNAVLNKYSRRVRIQFKPKAVRLKARRKLFCDRCGAGMVSSWYDRPLTLEEVVGRGLGVLISDWRREGG